MTIVAVFGISVDLNINSFGDLKMAGNANFNASGPSSKVNDVFSDNISQNFLRRINNLHCTKNAAFPQFTADSVTLLNNTLMENFIFGAVLRCLV